MSTRKAPTATCTHRLPWVRDTCAAPPRRVDAAPEHPKAVQALYLFIVSVENVFVSVCVKMCIHIWSRRVVAPEWHFLAVVTFSWV